MKRVANCNGTMDSRRPGAAHQAIFGILVGMLSLAVPIPTAAQCSPGTTGGGNDDHGNQRFEATRITPSPSGIEYQGIVARGVFEYPEDVDVFRLDIPVTSSVQIVFYAVGERDGTLRCVVYDSNRRPLVDYPSIRGSRSTTYPDRNNFCLPGFRYSETILSSGTIC